MLKKIILLLTAMLALASCAKNVDIYGYDKTMYDTPENQYKMGYRYLLGQGRPINYAEALKYFNGAADQGNRYAQSELGYLFAAGKGVTQSYAKAIFWYTKAADQGLAAAQYNLGVIYLNGLGTHVDKVRANDYFHRAAEQGFEPAQKVIA